MAFGDSCIKLGSKEWSRSILALASNLDEVYTRMLLHAKSISEENAANIVIHTLDTDVSLISLGLTEQIRGRLFIRTGTQNKVRIISTGTVKESLTMRFDVEDFKQAYQALLGIHTFIGCDIVNAFLGKGKVKPVKLILNPLLKQNTLIFEDLFATCMRTRRILMLSIQVVLCETKKVGSKVSTIMF